MSYEELLTAWAAQRKANAEAAARELAGEPPITFVFNSSI